MRLVIDGYNVIFAETHQWFGRLPSGSRVLGARGAARSGAGEPVRDGAGECERMRTELLQRLEQYRMRTDVEITVVFDGGEEGAHLARFQHYGGIEVVFSDPSSDADEEIKKLVRESSGARDLRVITDDRDLAQAAKRLGAKASGTEWLLDRMTRAETRRGDDEAKAEPACKFNGPPDFEVDAWVEQFGDLDEDDVAGEEDADEE